MIDSIWPSLNGYEVERPAGDPNALKLGKFTLLVGPSNSGKSRLLRAIFNAGPEQLYVYDSDLLQPVYAVLEMFRHQVPGQNSSDGVLRGQSLHLLLSRQPLTRKDMREALEAVKQMFNQVSRLGVHSSATIPVHNVIHQHGLSAVVDPLQNAILALQGEQDRYYVPILRGLRPLFEGLDLYMDRTIKDYCKGEGDRRDYIYTGFKLYQTLTSLLLGKPEGRRFVATYEKRLGDIFFGGLPVSLIPEHGTDTVSIKIGDEEQFRVFELGDGLQQAVLLTAAASLVEKPSIFCIEEPETFMHPGLLRQLVMFLDEFTPHQFICTTHSNHVLDFAETMDSFVVHRITKKVVSSQGATFNIRECKAERGLLLDLGVHPSSLYLANCTIWVEGITDRMYLRKFLKKYIEETGESRYRQYLENISYLFVEYQGAVLGHWNFESDSADAGEACGLTALRLCSSAFLIADQDISTKGDRLEVLTDQLGDCLHVLPGKEIENLLSEDVLRATAKREFGRRQARKEGLHVSALDGHLGKYATSPKGIGYFLDKALGIQEASKRFFSEKSGTVTDKVRFCKTALEVMDSVSWTLTPEASELCRKVFAHIEKYNPSPTAKR